MRLRSAATLTVAVLVAVAPHADAATKKKPKPITKSYDLTLLPFPDLTTAAGSGACAGAALQQGVNVDSKTIKVVGPGKLTVKINGFSGDWDAVLRDPSGGAITEGGGTQTPDGFSTPATPLEETLTYKYKKTKAATWTLVICNYIGSPQAHVTYTYVYS